MPTLHIIPIQQMQGDIDSQLEKMAYDEKMREFWDRGAQLATAERKGFAEGLAEARAERYAEGFAEGRAEEKIQNARDFKNRGVDIKIIADVTGLPLSEIEKL